MAQWLAKNIPTDLARAISVFLLDRFAQFKVHSCINRVLAKQWSRCLHDRQLADKIYTLRSERYLQYNNHKLATESQTAAEKTQKSKILIENRKE